MKTHEELVPLTGKNYVSADEATVARTTEGPLARFLDAKETLRIARNQFHDAKSQLVINQVVTADVLAVEEHSEIK